MSKVSDAFMNMATVMDLIYGFWNFRNHSDMRKGSEMYTDDFQTTVILVAPSCWRQFLDVDDGIWITVTSLG